MCADRTAHRDCQPDNREVVSLARCEAKAASAGWSYNVGGGEYSASGTLDEIVFQDERGAKAAGGFNLNSTQVHSGTDDDLLW